MKNFWIIDGQMPATGSQVLEVASNADKLALSGLTTGQTVIITGEGNRIEMYLGGGENSDSNWAVIKRGKVKLYVECNGGTSDDFILDGITCPDGETTYIGEYEVGTMLVIGLGTTLSWYEADQMVDADGMTMFWGKNNEDAWRLFLINANIYNRGGLFILSYHLPIRAKVVTLYTEST
jgi:hypothetical protein